MQTLNLIVDVFLLIAFVIPAAIALVIGIGLGIGRFLGVRL